MAPCFGGKRKMLIPLRHGNARKINRKKIRLVFRAFPCIIQAVKFAGEQSVCVKQEQRSSKKRLQKHF